MKDNSFKTLIVSLFTFLFYRRIHMNFYERYEEPILQSEKFNMSSGANVRIQIKEKSYIITLDIDTEMYRNLRMNTFKRGIRISSYLKKLPQQKISKQVVLTRDFTDLSQLSEDTITIDNKYYNMQISVKFSDFMRPDVKTDLRRELFKKEEISV